MLWCLGLKPQKLTSRGEQAHLRNTWTQVQALDFLLRGLSSDQIGFLVPQLETAGLHLDPEPHVGSGCLFWFWTRADLVSVNQSEISWQDQLVSGSVLGNSPGSLIGASSGIWVKKRRPSKTSDLLTLNLFDTWGHVGHVRHRNMSRNEFLRGGSLVQTSWTHNKNLLLVSNASWEAEQRLDEPQLCLPVDLSVETSWGHPVSSLSS